MILRPIITGRFLAIYETIICWNYLHITTLSSQVCSQESLKSNELADLVEFVFGADEVDKTPFALDEADEAAMAELDAEYGGDDEEGNPCPGCGFTLPKYYHSQLCGPCRSRACYL